MHASWLILSTRKGWFSIKMQSYDTVVLCKLGYYHYIWNTSICKIITNYDWLRDAIRLIEEQIRLVEWTRVARLREQEMCGRQKWRNWRCCNIRRSDSFSSEHRTAGICESTAPPASCQRSESNHEGTLALEPDTTDSLENKIQTRFYQSVSKCKRKWRQRRPSDVKVVGLIPWDCAYTHIKVPKGCFCSSAIEEPFWLP